MKNTWTFQREISAEFFYISNATLSRFAKKCGYKGYRELVFDYEKRASGADK